MIEVKKSEMVVKITVFTQVEGDARVIYFRSGLPIDIVIKYNWYYSYLAARVKVKHPRWRVVLTTVNQELKFGDDYKKEKIGNLIKHYKAKITQVKNEYVCNDLFGLGQESRQHRLDMYEDKLQSLIKGEYDGYVPESYINNIKSYI